MSNKVYDVVNKVQRWLPAAGAFYIGVSKIWGLPFGTEINETILLFATLLAATLEVATVQYNKKKESGE